MAAERRKISIKTGLIAILAVALCVVLIKGVHLVSPQSVEIAIDQNLGSESDINSVRGFMDAHQILYTGYSPTLRTAYGKIYRSSIGLMKGYVFITFTFNESGKLISHEVRERFQFFWE